jgi:hypothetical protein
VLENISCSREKANHITEHISLLVSDYFNYSVPGLSNLSLHGLKLLDYQSKALAEALCINSSIKYLHLSSNMFENDTLISLFKAISSNVRSSVILLDLSGNLITFSKEARKLFKDYVSSSKLKVLRVLLDENPISEPYDPSPDNFQCLQVVTPFTASETHHSKFSNAITSPSSPHKFKLIKKVRKLTRAIAAYQGAWMDFSASTDIAECTATNSR